MSIKILDTNWEICDWIIMFMKKPQIPHNIKSKYTASFESVYKRLIGCVEQGHNN